MFTGELFHSEWKNLSRMNHLTDSSIPITGQDMFENRVKNTILLENAPFQAGFSFLDLSLSIRFTRPFLETIND